MKPMEGFAVAEAAPPETAAPPTVRVIARFSTVSQSGFGWSPSGEKRG